MTTDEQYYYRIRAEEELAVAFEAADETSAEVHRKLAKLYLSKVAEPNVGGRDLRRSAP